MALKALTGHSPRPESIPTLSDRVRSISFCSSSNLLGIPRSLLGNGTQEGTSEFYLNKINIPLQKLQQKIASTDDHSPVDENSCSGHKIGRIGGEVDQERTQFFRSSQATERD